VSSRGARPVLLGFRSGAAARLAVTALVVAGVMAACSPGAVAPFGTVVVGTDVPAGAPVELTVYGAASLRDALARLGAAYERSHPGVRLTISTDSSAALATQVSEGAPADVFLSADTSSPQKLVDGGFAASDPITFATNRLAIVVADGNPASIATPADLARPGLMIIGAGDEVPITRYAGQLVSNLARLPGYPADFEHAYAANVVSKEDNVRGIVARIELGEGDAGIVYATDVAASSKLASVAIPDAANVAATYAGVVVGASAHQDAARAFLDWVAGPAGQAVLAGFGFLPPP
jgi:molybdate transport system substrate-binding protein